MSLAPPLPAFAMAGACAGLPFTAALAAAGGGRLGGGEPLEISLGRIIAALLVCLAVAGFAILLVRQRSGKIDLATLFSRIEVRPRAIRIVETRRLSQHADICLLRHDDREYLLLILAGDARVLSERAVATLPDEEAERA